MQPVALAAFARILPLIRAGFDCYTTLSVAFGGG
jgi:hypothetical protein